MKSLILILAGACTLVACNSNKTTSLHEDNVPLNTTFSAIQWERGEVTEMHIFGENNDTTIATFKYSFAKDASPLKQLTDSLTYSFLTDNKQSPLVNRSFFEKEAKLFVNDFKEFISDATFNKFPWYLDVEVDYCEIDSMYVKGEFMIDSYTGGAHGSHFIGYRMINTSTNKIVQLSDLYANRKELDKRAEKVFRSTYEIDADANLQEEGYWFEDGKFTLNENFYFDQNDIVFYFNPYEIGPYAMGTFTIHIPLSSLKDLEIKR